MGRYYPATLASVSRIRASFAAAAFLLAGCSTSTTEIDSTRAEAFVKQAFDQPPRAVDCPSGVEAKAGRTITCKVTSAGGRRLDVTLHIVDGKGRVRFGAGDVKPVP
jgi:starvation-inducible outer membrane lipoprotein